MEVTKTNFQELLPRIKNAIAQADFISIDCELTGLHVGTTISAYDTQAQYYDKIRRAAKEFLVIQYGLCLFRYDKTQKMFKQQGYNFYTFPRPSNKFMPDHRFLCQASSLDFLISQGFDFNKLFKEGIPYLNSPEEDKYRDLLLDKQKTRANLIQQNSNNEQSSNSGISVTPEDRLKVDDIFNKIETFISGNDQEFILPRSNAFIRRVVYGEAPSKLGSRASLETRILENKDRVLVVTRAKTKEILEEEDRKKVEEEDEELKAAIGFSEVIRCIIESGKLVVGHNMFLDLLHTIEKFLMPLPDDYDEFKELTKATLSNIVDTKYMSSISPFNTVTDSSVLSHLFETVQKKPFDLPKVEVEDGAQGYELECDKAHEAGYDAYITGMCFAAMWMYLGKVQGDGGDPHDIFNDQSAVESYKNRLFLMKVQDIPYIHLSGKEVVPLRDNVLYVTFPNEWKYNDLTNLFSPFGTINIAWIDDQSAYVGLQSHEKTCIAISTLSQSNRYTVTTYAKRQAELTKIMPSSPRRSSSTNLSISSKKRSFSLGSNSSRKRSIDHKDDLWGNKTTKKVKQTFSEDNNWN